LGDLRRIRRKALSVSGEVGVYEGQSGRAAQNNFGPSKAPALAHLPCASLMVIHQVVICSLKHEDI
jgi:hypothetical protein